MSAPSTPEERLARLEGVYEHLATKADLATLETKLHKDLNRNLYITIGTIVAVAGLLKYLP